MHLSPLGKWCCALVVVMTLPLHADAGFVDVNIPNPPTCFGKCDEPISYETAPCSIIDTSVMRCLDVNGNTDFSSNVPWCVRVTLQWTAFNQDYTDAQQLSSNLETGKTLRTKRVAEVYRNSLRGRTGTCYYDPDTLGAPNLQRTEWD